MGSFDLVTQFHKIFGHPAPGTPDPAAMANRKLAKLRILLIAHELIEAAQALAVDLDINYLHASMGALSGKELEQYCVVTDAATPGNLPPNFVLLADALGDLDYVVNGGAIAYGINLPAITAEVHASNMSKLGADGMPILDSVTNKVIKGPNYVEPDIGGVLLKQADAALAEGQQINEHIYGKEEPQSNWTAGVGALAEALGETKAADTTGSTSAAGTSVGTANTAASPTSQGEPSGESVGGTSPADQTSASSGSSSSPTTVSVQTASAPVGTGDSADSDPNLGAGAAIAASALGATTTTAESGATASVKKDAGTDTPSQEVRRILGELDDGHDGSVV